MAHLLAIRTLRSVQGKVAHRNTEVIDLINSSLHASHTAYEYHLLKKRWAKTFFQGFPGGAVVENLPANAGDTGSSPGLGRSHMPRSN